MASDNGSGVLRDFKDLKFLVEQTEKSKTKAKKKGLTKALGILENSIFKFNVKIIPAGALFVKLDDELITGTIDEIDALKTKKGEKVYHVKMEGNKKVYHGIFKAPYKLVALNGDMEYENQKINVAHKFFMKSLKSHHENYINSLKVVHEAGDVVCADTFFSTFYSETLSDALVQKIAEEEKKKREIELMYASRK